MNTGDGLGKEISGLYRNQNKNHEYFCIPVYGRVPFISGAEDRLEEDGGFLPVHVPV